MPANRCARQLGKLWKEELAATATEYAFLIAFIAIVASAGMTIMGGNLSSFFNNVGSALAEAPCGLPPTASDSGGENSNKCKDKNP